MSIDRPDFEREPGRESLDSIKLSEYINLPDHVREWLETTEEVPSAVQEKLGSLDPNLSLREALQKIRQAIIAAAEGKSSRPQSFEESRFTSFAEVVNRGLESCGAHTRAIGTTFRSHGVPVRFVDGTHTEGHETHDHAWLDIYVPRTGEWIESDTRTEDFSLKPGNERKKIFHDWEELRSKGR
jgi:hypothetical protein